MAEASNELTNNDFGVVLDAGAAMIVSWEVGSASWTAEERQDMLELELGAGRRDRGWGRIPGRSCTSPGALSQSPATPLPPSPAGNGSCIVSHLEYAQGSRHGAGAPRCPHRPLPDLRPWTRNAARRVHIVA
jgi:hypothetical protein